MDIASEHKLRIRASTTHHRLMIVVANSIMLPEPLKVREIALLHIVKTHCDPTLKSVSSRRIGNPVPDCYRHPCVEVLFAAAWVAGINVRNRAGRLLPHLIKTVNRISYVAKESRRHNEFVEELSKEGLATGVKLRSAYERERSVG